MLENLFFGLLKHLLRNVRPQKQQVSAPARRSESASQPVHPVLRQKLKPTLILLQLRPDRSRAVLRLRNLLGFHGLPDRHFLACRQPVSAFGA